MEVVKLENVVKRYGNQSVINGINLSINQGEIFGILGPNGVGKTTTIEMIIGIRSYEGSIKVFGEEVRNHLDSIKRRLGISLQITSLFPNLSVEETLNYFAILYDIPDYKKRVKQLIDDFNLSELLKQKTKSLSGGQRQRLIIALTVIHDPEIIFLDEPSTGLDPDVRNHIWGYIKKLHKKGKTIILTTHYMEEAHVLCNRIAFMNQGKIQAIGSEEELFKISKVVEKILIRRNLEEDLINSIRALDSCVSAYQDFHGVIALFSEKDSIGKVKQLLSQFTNYQNVDCSIEPPNLNDLFIMYTGRRLDDK